MSSMNQYEALGLSPEQIEGLNRIAAAYTTAGHPTSTDDLMNFAFSPPTMEDLERLASVLQNEFRRDGIRIPRHWYIRWWLLDALDALRRLLRQLWAAIAAVACPECCLDGGRESGACEGCRAREGCREMVVLP